MKRSAHRFASSNLFLAILAALSLLATGCTAFRETTCAQFEESRKDTDYTTQYRFSEPDSETAVGNFKPLPRGDNAAVRLYRMRVDPPTIKSCNHLTISKEIYLQRRLDTKLVLEEVREFYTADGALIATKTESIGNQLRTGGFYSGTASLPIPEKAPPGKYRIVSKLVLKKKSKPQITVLARTSVSFQVIARK